MLIHTHVLYVENYIRSLSARAKTDYMKNYLF